MLQIKTIRNRLDNNIYFDDEVNAALRDGWTLKKRTVLRPISHPESRQIHMMLYAELEKEVADEERRFNKRLTAQKVERYPLAENGITEDGIWE